MIHKSIATNLGFNNLSDPASLLCLMMIVQADDDGRMRGEARHVKALAAPLRKWSESKVEEYLKAIEAEGTIVRWGDGKNLFIEFPNWSKYQHIRSDRYKASDIPRHDTSTTGTVVVSGIPNDNQVATQSSGVQSSTVQVESSPGKFNSGESSNPLADKNTSYKKIYVASDIDPEADFKPTNELGAAVLYAWRELEPENKRAFFSTYLRWANTGLPASCFYEFVSEMKADGKVRNFGAVFNDKAIEYFNNLVGKRG